MVEVDDGLTVVGDALAERDPALAQLAAAAASGLPPAGPEARRRPGVDYPAAGGPVIVRPLCADDAGFGLHAATRAGAHDARAREALLKYILRPPVATEHVTFTPDGLVRIALKKPFRDGTVAVDMDPLSLLPERGDARTNFFHPPKSRSASGGSVAGSARRVSERKGGFERTSTIFRRTGLASHTRTAAIASDFEIYGSTDCPQLSAARIPPVGTSDAICSADGRIPYMDAPTYSPRWRCSFPDHSRGE